MLDMGIGGAQKSLLSFCRELANSNRISEFDIDLMIIMPSGPYFKMLPEKMNVIEPPEELRYLGTRFSLKMLSSGFTIKALLGELSWAIRKKFGLFDDALNLPQRLWANWKNYIPQLEEKYDVAVSYIDGVPNYYVIDKVQANKKILWIHNEYQKQKYDAKFDEEYFQKSDGIITISHRCRKCIEKEFPQYKEKVHVLENISSERYILEQSEIKIGTEFDNYDGNKLLTVARLNRQKGVDLAVEAAALLKRKNFDFRWVILGEGAERQRLEKMIEDYGLAENVLLAGSKENPYVYMKQCDVLVQPSRTEGKSIVLDEAKILCKPIVSTNYTTVSDSINHGENGWVVDMQPDAISEGIILLCTNIRLREQLCANLRKASKGNEEELNKYIETMF